MSDVDQAAKDAAALAEARITNVGPLRMPEQPYRPSAKDQKTPATVASVMALADAMGSLMAEREKAMRLRISTLEKQVAALAKRLEARS